VHICWCNKCIYLGRGFRYCTIRHGCIHAVRYNNLMPPTLLDIKSSIIKKKPAAVTQQFLTPDALRQPQLMTCTSRCQKMEPHYPNPPHILCMAPAAPFLLHGRQRRPSSQRVPWPSPSGATRRRSWGGPPRGPPALAWPEKRVC
jgi:hypothetical protein